MKPIVLRSPNVAEGGAVHVVRLVEVQPFARGGLARAAPKREINLHISTPELKQLSTRWGKPRLNIKGIPEYSFKMGALKGMSSFADGGPIGWTPPQDTAPTPEATAGRTRTADPTDYYTYGEGPEHQFFGANVTPPQPQFPHIPATPTGPSTQNTAGNAANLALIGSGLAGASSIAGALGYDNALTQGAGAIGKGLTGNYAGALKDAKGLYSNLTGTGTGAGAGASGVAAGLGAGAGALSGSAALGAAAPVATDAALSNLGSITAGELFGTSGSAAAGAGAGSLGTAGGTSSLGTGAAGTSGAGATGALAGSGIATALPLAAVGWALADAFNKSGDIKSAATSSILDQMVNSQGWKLKDPRTQTYELPDGRFVRADQNARAVSEAVRKGDREAANTAWQQWMDSAVTPKGHARGGAFGGAGSSGSWGSASGNTDPSERHVRGPGTGRSDSIPAQLSDGEYVLTAEDVSLLGDGSNEAGAKRLDGFRQALRKHKGGALARGKISPNAKAPMAYLKGAGRGTE